MKKTTVSKIVIDERRSYGIRVETFDDSFTIPVIDVRDGDNARNQAEAVLKNARIQAGSKFIKPSYSLLGYSYNQSRK